VISKTSTTVTIDKPFNERQDNPNDWKIPSNVNLQVNMSYSPTTFCSMQIIRVPNYLNFHLNTVMNTGPLEYDRTNGIGGIFIIKVKDTFSMDTTAASRNLSGHGKGRLNIATPNYNHCNNTDSKCIKMGGSLDSDTRGGGGIVIYAKNASFEKGSNNLRIRANGGTESSLSPAQRHAGSVLLRVENFEFIDNFNFGNSISADGQIGGDPGIVRFEYCNVIGAGSLPTTNPAIGSTGGYAVDDDPPYCP
jgi:hypothetical protein